MQILIYIELIKYFYHSLKLEFKIYILYKGYGNFMTKILIISDTHGDKKVFLDVINYENPNYVIHAGDYEVDVAFISRNVDFFVKGNCDYEGDPIKLFNIDGINFFLTHGNQFSIFKGSISKQIIKTAKMYRANVAITGHTHKEEIEKEDEILRINPGSLIRPRNSKGIPTYAILNISGGEIADYEIKEWNPI